VIYIEAFLLVTFENGSVMINSNDDTTIEYTGNQAGEKADRENLCELNGGQHPFE
jgi:hypothetical protein